MDKTIKEKDILDDLPWGEIEEISQRADFQRKFSKISEETLKLVIRKENLSFLTQSAIKSLQKSDPANATDKNAKILVDIMQRFAKQILNEEEDK